ncbi:MAG: UDP-N-acetylmuramate dehydrogenase, partial [Candidatus Hydrogenedentales bacterium]
SLYSYRGQTFCPRGGLILSGLFRFEPVVEDQRAIYDRYIQRRKEKQPQGKCCGSVFKNPNGDHAGRLIEACGLKGTRHGGALISPMHANFIMNDDNATSADILALIAMVKQTVRDRFSVELEEEVVYIG